MVLLSPTFCGPSLTIPLLDFQPHPHLHSQHNQLHSPFGLNAISTLNTMAYFAVHPRLGDCNARLFGMLPIQQRPRPSSGHCMSWATIWSLPFPCMLPTMNTTICQLHLGSCTLHHLGHHVPSLVVFHSQWVLIAYCPILWAILPNGSSLFHPIV